jgi:hypothetical protein
MSGHTIRIYSAAQAAVESSERLLKQLRYGTFEERGSVAAEVRRLAELAELCSVELTPPSSPLLTEERRPWYPGQRHG